MESLTDASNWATIEVPEYADPYGPSLFKSTFQLLANRTKYLYDYVVAGADLQEFIDDLAAVTATNGAHMVGFEDGGGHTTATTVDATLDELLAGRIQRRQLIATHATITAAAATETLNIGAVLPANATILAVSMYGLTPFSGGTVGDFTVDIGSSGDADALIDGADLFSAAVDGAPATMTAGVNPHKTFVAAGAQLTAKFDCASDDVADATAGSVTIDVLFTVLPVIPLA